MSLGVLLAFYKANEAAILTILFIISEIVGASSKIKANGFLSFVLMQVQSRLKQTGKVDPTP